VTWRVGKERQIDPTLRRLADMGRGNLAVGERIETAARQLDRRDTATYGASSQIRELCL